MNDITVPWHENITHISVRPTNEGNSLSPVNFWAKKSDERKQNFWVRLDFLHPVLLFGKAFTWVDYLYDRNTEESIATYCNADGEKQKFYPMQSCNFWNDLHILSAPESQLNPEEKSLRLNMAQAISEIECCNID
ncbi:MAG: hypothetical protein K2M95_00995 [Clostridiales bacterium]|nr:hypothetical protein [Clostridiales bacterium]